MHLITRFNQGGTAQWLKYLNQGLEANGIRSVIAVGNVLAPEVEDTWLRETQFARVKTLSKNINFVRDFQAFLEIRKLILELKPDILNTHTSKAGVLGRLAARSIPSNNRPITVHTFHGHLLYGYFGVIGSKVVTMIERLFSKITDLYIISGRKVSNELLGASIITKSNFTTITPGLPAQIDLSPETSRSELNLNHHDFIIGWLGRLTEIKDPKMVLEIATKLPQLTFIIGGEGELKESLVDSAPPNVKILGWVKQEVFWSASDLALLTSKNEAQPYSLIEAIHAGKAIVARDVGSVQDVLSHGDYGLLFENRDEAVSSILKLSNENKLLAKMSKSARESALTVFSLDSFVDAHISAYKNPKLYGARL